MTEVSQGPSMGSRWRRGVGCAIVIVVVVITGTWFVGKVRDAREAARSLQCMSRLNQMHLAFHQYHDTYGCFPPAYVADADGNPMHSWRVLILQFIDSAHLYEKYKFDAP